MRDEESQPGFCTVNASSESVSKALKTFAEAAREIRLDNRSRGLCQIFPATIPEGAGVTQDCMMCFIQETLESLNHLAASSKGQGNLKAGEFLAFAAEANGKQWTLFSKNRRRYSRIVRDHEQSLEVLRECGRVQASIRATWKNCWLSQYISHAKLTMYVCTWDD
ncbi:hypothetical protein N0V84_009168 [Fusarium piperis]|uniref:Uncharacterized protein n=1 Tax=Fusarium piperis TaxID=1435070 RepID=A0A9W8W6U3_9HYPO|nr:hypothetical protein N0V84_009168 [Fusarium piperis]